MTKRKCKNCGRRFKSSGPGDLYCSPLCRQTGFFVGGGGDSSKPNGKPTGAGQKPMAGAGSGSSRNVNGKFNRVLEVMKMPVSQRWAVAKDFTDEERAYFRRLVLRSLYESDRIEREFSWDSPIDGDEESYNGSEAELWAIGDSDDGTV